MFGEDLFQQIQMQLMAEGRPPTFYEVTQLPEANYPRLHELQIQENNAAWAAERQAQIERHAQRVRRHLRRHSRRRQPGEATNGRRRQVWCVELGRAFASLCEAGRFVGRAPSNVLQAIRFGVKCGVYHWERFDPSRHVTGIEPIPAPESPVALPLAAVTEAIAPTSFGDDRSPPEQHDGRVGGERGEEGENGGVPGIAGVGLAGCGAS